MSDVGERQHPARPTRDNPCDGCHECGLRCTAGVQMTKQEFGQIVKCLREQDQRQVTRVLEQEKRVPWFEDIETEHCLFYDVTKRRCIVYPARPLICRLFGRVEWLPCPLEKPLSMLKDGLGVIRAYSGETRATFPEWCAEEGLFDFR
ncbi:MAG TPA: YkgJ family cysteine cluster protein [Armatimonadota bacterium]|nr:YkgJ family cysteine cluster protein [Armatimonadota bacterium]